MTHTPARVRSAFRVRAGVDGCSRIIMLPPEGKDGTKGTKGNHATSVQRDGPLFDFRTNRMPLPFLPRLAAAARDVARCWGAGGGAHRGGKVRYRSDGGSELARRGLSVAERLRLDLRAGR